MFLTWRTERDRSEGDDIVEETVACVAPWTLEWRQKRADGVETVTAARFAEDATLLGVWRGAKGGVGTRVEVVEERVDLDEAIAEADRRGRSLGLSTKEAKTARDTAVEEIETPAGRFRCTRHSFRVSLLLVSGTTTAWYAEQPLPFSQLVRIEMKGPFSFHERMELVAYGTTGAAPTLRLP